MALTKRPMLANAPRTVVVVVVLLLISLGVYSRKDISWGATGDYFIIEMSHAEAGIPHWLIINQAEIEGNAPPIDPLWLPGAEDCEPGVHVRWASFSLAAVGAAAIGIMLHGISMRFSHGAAGLSRRRILFGYAVPIVVAIVTVAPTPTKPAWFGMVLVLALLPMAIIGGAAVMRSYRHAFLAGILVFLSLWWSTRVSDLFRTEHLIHGLPDEADLLIAAVFLPAIVLLFLVGTLISRCVAGRTGAAPQQESTSG